MVTDFQLLFLVSFTIMFIDFILCRPYINDQVLDMEHSRVVETALAEFDSRKKLGGEEFSLKYREQLVNEIEEAYNNYKAHNDSKNIFKAANTPITLFAMWSVLYVLSQVFLHDKFKT